MTISIINCLCGGIYLSLGFVHMLPYSIRLSLAFELASIIPYAMTFIGFAFLLFIEKVLFDVQNVKYQSFPTNEILLNDDNSLPHYFSDEDLLSDENRDLKRTSSNYALQYSNAKKYQIQQNKEVQFKKIFTQSGRFVSMTKFTCN